MRSVSMRGAFAAVALSAVLTLSLPVLAQEAVPCDACASCTAALAAPRARVALDRDLTVASGAGPCLVVRGANAQFDGLEHTLHVADAGATSVRVEAAGVTVRNVHVDGGAVGITVAPQGDRCALLHNTLAVASVGVRIDGARGTRVLRHRITRGRVGVGFGVGDDGQCARGPARVAGAVVASNYIEGADTGVLACDTVPLLAENIIVRNGVGVNLAVAEGVAGVDDPCVCSPSLAEARPGTALLYSSGCGGCVVHEGWVPDLRRAGNDIRVRETRREHLDQARRFDDYVALCAPEILDALGIPGCVPNYACVGNLTVAKRRGNNDALEMPVRLGGPEDVGNFVQTCRTDAQRDYTRGAQCSRFALRGNTLCGNARGDIQAVEGARRFQGRDNACARALGWGDGAAVGCARACPAELPSAPSVAVPVANAGAGGAAAAVAAPNAAQGIVAPVAVVTPSANEPARAGRSTARSGEAGTRAVLLVASLVGIALLVANAMRGTGKG